MASAAPAVLNLLPLPHPIHPKVLPRIRRWQWHLWLSLADPAEAEAEAEAFPVVLYPLPLPLRTQASLAAAAVASALPLADPAEVAAAAFPACGSSGPLPPPTLPQASPTTDPTTTASPSDPGTSVALVCGSAAVCCCDRFRDNALSQCFFFFFCIRGISKVSVHKPVHLRGFKGAAIWVSVRHL